MLVTKLVGKWTVLSRPECSLCETFMDELVEVLGSSAALVEVRDITGEIDLERRYGARIPVLLIDEEFVCAYRLDRERLQPYIKS